MAVRRVHKFALPGRAQAVGLHQAADLIKAYFYSLGVQGFTQWSLKQPSQKSHISHTIQAWDNIVCAKRHGYSPKVAANSAIRVLQPVTTKAHNAAVSGIFSFALWRAVRRRLRPAGSFVAGLQTCVRLVTLRFAA
ncbi:hypothetical protein LOY63_11395 [Pseudomonas asplenii]|nr:hypothetical protein [Pseudomonas asplenii]UZE32082.1 hypothetical protein LOY63_11395 [Pseudomonas asplenii]